MLESMPIRHIGDPSPDVNQATRLRVALRTFSKWMHFPDGGDVVPALLGAVAANYLKGEDPVWFMLTGPTGGGKTTLIDTLDWMPDAHYTTELSPAGLLTWTKDETGEVRRGGILPKLEPSGFLVISEFSSLLHKSPNQQPLLVALRRVYDGKYERGIKSESLKEELIWRGKCGFIGGSAPGIESHRHVMQEMGERFIYYRLAYSSTDEDLAADMIGARGSRGILMRNELQAATRLVLERARKYALDFELTPDERTRLKHYAHFAARARSYIDRDTSFARTAQDVHAREMGSGRMLRELSALFKGLLVIGTSYKRAWRIIDTVCWSCIPVLRAAVLRVVLQNTDGPDCKHFGGLRVIADLVQNAARDGVGCAHTSLGRALEDLTLQGVLDQLKGGRKGVMDGWRAKSDVWMAYTSIAATAEYPPEEPERRLWRHLELVEPQIEESETA